MLGGAGGVGTKNNIMSGRYVAYFSLILIYYDIVQGDLKKKIFFFF